MGYFANGSEGDMWEEENCRRCQHDKDDGCAVLAVHLLYNYDQQDAGQDKLKAAMQLLIPRADDGVFNGRCSMLLEREEMGR